MELFGFGFSGSEMMVLLIIALLVLGPRHLREASQALARTIAAARKFSQEVRESTRTKNTVDLSALRELDRLDPRRMIREAVREEMAAWRSELESAPAPSGIPSRPHASTEPTDTNETKDHQ